MTRPYREPLEVYRAWQSDGIFCQPTDAEELGLALGEMVKLNSALAKRVCDLTLELNRLKRGLVP